MSTKLVLWNARVSPAFREALRREAKRRTSADRIVNQKDIIVNAVLAYDNRLKRTYEAIKKEWGNEYGPEPAKTA